MKSSLHIYCDNVIEATWFRNLHPDLQNLDYRIIRGRGENTRVVEDLIQYDRPDIILANDSRAFLVVEKTREVPTGHNVGQRVARLVKAVENGVPTIKFFPFDAKKHGEYSAICNLNIRLLLAFDNMWNIHNCPIIALNWKADKHGELIDDGSEDDELKSVMYDFVGSGFSSSCARFPKIREDTKNEYSRRLTARPQYGGPPPSVTFENTDSFLSRLKCELSIPDRLSLQSRAESLVYTIIMTEEKCKRQDPYTGTQFIYDYAYCRSGRTPEEKKRNLVLFFPKIRKAVWERKNPNNAFTKSCNWYLVANALVFSDGIKILR